MELASDIIFCGRRLVVRGFDPMSVLPQRVYLEDPRTGERVVELYRILRPDRLPVGARIVTNYRPQNLEVGETGEAAFPRLCLPDDCDGRSDGSEAFEGECCGVRDSDAAVRDGLPE